MQATIEQTPQVAATPLLGPEIRKAIEAYYPRYPSRRAVVLPALHVVNEHLGYVPLQAVIEIADLLELPRPRCRIRSAFIIFSPRTNRPANTKSGCAAR